jgi:hypothetical protein
VQVGRAAKTGNEDMADSTCFLSGVGLGGIVSALAGAKEVC